MMGMRSMFLIVSKTNSDLHVGSGVNTMHALKGVGWVRFQLDSCGSLEVVGVIYVLGMKFLSISTLEDMGYAVMFENVHVLIRLEGEDTQNVSVWLDIKEGMFHMVLGQPVVGLRGSWIVDQIRVQQR
jgi:hypothetical protein